MNDERRTYHLHTGKDFLNVLTDEQRQAWDDLTKFGWNFFAIRQLDQREPTTLVQAPNQGHVRIFRRDGKIDFATPVKVRSTSR